MKILLTLKQESQTRLHYYENIPNFVIRNKNVNSILSL